MNNMKENMDLTIRELDKNKNLGLEAQNFEKAKSTRDNFIWQQLDKITVEEGIKQWLSTLSSHTQATYRYGMQQLIELSLMEPTMNLQGFALLNHNSIIDRIKLVKKWSESSRQARAACYISFSRFLSRRTQGIISKIVPSKEGISKTFYKVRQKVKTSAMTQGQWIRFFAALERINPRDCLIAKVILQGGKRLNEVLSLQVKQIIWEQNRIIFVQSKTKGIQNETVITYSEGIMQQLKGCIGERSGDVFITRSGKRVRKTQLAITFARAGKLTGIPFKVTPHVLRASTVTYLKQQGFADSDIMKVTGHASSEMVYAYDKSSREENASTKVDLVS